jgi:hypothetical protein
MVVYAESSAILSWLFGDAASRQVLAVLSRASLVLTSELTDIECARAIHRALSLKLVTKGQATRLHETYRASAKAWDRLPIGDRVQLVATAPFPMEPVRALDAIHLGSILVALEAWPALTILTLDQRVRVNLGALGLQLVAP